MDIYYRPIRDGSHRLWAVPKGAPKYSRYKLCIDLEPLGDGACEAAGAFGELDQETIINIGRVAMKLGYHTMNTCAVPGTKVSDFLTYTHSDENLDYYTVDLFATAERLGILSGLN